MFLRRIYDELKKILTKILSHCPLNEAIQQLATCDWQISSTESHFVRNSVGHSPFPTLEMQRAENHILNLLLNVLSLCQQIVYVRHLSVFVAVHGMEQRSSMLRGVKRSLCDKDRNKS